MACGFVTERQGSSTDTHFAVCVWIENRYTVTKPWQTWKEVMYLLTDHDGQLLLNSDLWTEELAVKLILFTVTQSQYTGVTEIWTVL